MALIILPFPYPKPTISTKRLNLFQAMSSSSKSQSSAPVYKVPGLDPEDMDRVADQTFQRYSASSVKRNGKGVAVVWFRNDLRVLDNEALYKAWISSQEVLAVYCVDPRLFGSTHYFGFPKTGALRAQFLIECLADLKKNLMKRGLNLLIQHGSLRRFSLLLQSSRMLVYAQKETCSEELNVERLVRKGLQRVVLPLSSAQSSGPSSTNNPKLQLLWGTTMYHIDDLPFDTLSLPDSIEAKCTVRGCIKLPAFLGPPPSIEDWGCVPSLDQFGLQSPNVSKGMKFVGGESAALGRVNEYFWKKARGIFMLYDLLRIYKHTRNGMLGPDYSTKFSPWLASGSLSPRFIDEEGVVRIDMEGLLQVSISKIWEFPFPFRWPRNVEHRWSQDKILFESWRDGRTGYPLIDANMKELSTTGFMSNRGRQIVCSFLVRDMGIDWRMGAEWFETCLLDYDPCSNYGNWTYGAGIGNDPREDRYFSIPKQARTYDPEGEYVAYWLPQLESLTKEERNFPGRAYMKQVVPLKFGNTSRHQNQDKALAARGTNFGGRQTKGQRR
ncbi:cryptochrome 3 [Prunus dulcis]|uniref:Cryptochrome DASH n=1 Tax=Prunus dulcis TaxID=3755 RepID=A0A4Y1QUB8_PRUDU|nr:cryptochrome 3 [Prunus dulcis]